MSTIGLLHSSPDIHIELCWQETNPTSNSSRPASSRDPDVDRHRTTWPHPTFTQSQRGMKCLNSRTIQVIPARNIDSRAIEIQHVQTWATRNNLNLNCKKSYEIISRKPRSRASQNVPELAGVTRVTPLKVLGVTMMSNFSMTDHVSDVLASSGQSLYALRILRSNGMSEKNLQTIFCASVIAKLTYTSPAWRGFANADVRGRIQAFIRRSINAGFCPGDMSSFQELCENADDKLFRCVTFVDNHPLHRFLPPKVAFIIIIRMMFKNMF